MVEMINANSGRIFYVDESRVDEYIALGHKRKEKAEEKPKAKRAPKAKK